MNIIDKNKYDEFSDILTGCRTALDAHYFGNKYVKFNPEMKSIVLSMISGKRYEYILDMNTMMTLMDRLDRMIYKDDVMEVIEDYLSKTTDPTQRKTLYKIANLKIIKPEIMKHPTINLIKTNFMTKKCPHCNLECSLSEDSTYTICGYEDKITGYNVKGCGRDWCFICEKMLCKKWDTDKLFLDNNKYHDDVCCQNHAIENGNLYEKMYCQCDINNYVHR